LRLSTGSRQRAADWALPSKEVNRTVPLSALDEQDFPPDLAGRRAVVTGAARGIGAAIAKRLIGAGARVIAVDKNKENLLETYHDIPRCELIKGDLASDEVALLAEEILQAGPVELIVNNVGISTHRGFRDITREEFREVHRTNLEGPWFFTKRLIEALLEEPRVQGVQGAGRPRGAIVFICSLHANVVLGEPHYGTSKAGVAQLARELAWEYAPDGIRVNSISPGWIRTAEDPEADEQKEKYQRLRSRIALGRPGIPDEVARVAVSLLSDVRMGYVTGVNVPVDGGLSLSSWATIRADEPAGAGPCSRGSA
jgi:NAD(P)-dependent dehydrogenase (short-subunit alcohol dehydrogenase family)